MTAWISHALYAAAIAATAFLIGSESSEVWLYGGLAVLWWVTLRADYFGS